MGGAERALLDMMSAIRRAEPSWALELLLGQDGPLAAHARDVAHRVHILPLPSKLARLGDASMAERSLHSFEGLRLVQRFLSDGASSAVYLQRLRKTLSAAAPDVIHSNGLKMHLLGAYARSAHAALVWHLHDYIGARPLTSRLLKTARRRCSVVVANSKSVADDARHLFGETFPIRTIHNSIDLERFTPRGGALDLDRLAHLPPAEAGTIRVGLVAAFARWKGHQTFLEAIAKLAPTANLRAYIIGGPLYETDGSQYTQSELESAARAFGLESVVGFTGFVADSAAAMRALDVVVHASTAPEPFGLAIAEAMACERPVVVSFAGGARELVTPGVDALIHQPGDAEGLADALLRLVEDASLRRRLGAAARQSAIARFDPARVQDELVSLYGMFRHSAAA